METKNGRFVNCKDLHAHLEGCREIENPKKELNDNKGRQYNI